MLKVNGAKLWLPPTAPASSGLAAAAAAAGAAAAGVATDTLTSSYALQAAPIASRIKDAFDRKEQAEKTIRNRSMLAMIGPDPVLDQAFKDLKRANAEIADLRKQRPDLVAAEEASRKPKGFFEQLVELGRKLFPPRPDLFPVDKPWFE